MLKFYFFLYDVAVCLVYSLQGSSLLKQLSAVDKFQSVLQVQVESDNCDPVVYQRQLSAGHESPQTLISHLAPQVPSEVSSSPKKLGSAKDKKITPTGG